LPAVVALVAAEPHPASASPAASNGTTMRVDMSEWYAVGGYRAGTPPVTTA
jgi:hypothetical protein